ncbi:MAG: MFS transporter [Candidatus Acidiferrum sp.]
MNNSPGAKTNSSAESSVSSLQCATLAKILWRLLPFLFLLYVVAYLDRINVGFAALQMRSQLGFNDAVYGLGAGMFFAGYVLFQIPSNLILQRVGARRSISVLMIVWGIISSSMLFVRTPFGFYTMRFLLGVAEAGFFPGIIFYMRDWFPASVRARAVALFMTAGPVSGVIGGPVSGALLGLHLGAGLAGWQWLFLIEGLPAIWMGVVVFFFLADRPQLAAWLSSEERSWLVGTLERESLPTFAAAKQNPFAAFLNPKVWLLSFTYFGVSTGTYAISLWLPSVLHKISTASNLKIGFISAIPYLFAAIAMVLVGIHSDHSGERRWHVALSGLAAAAAFVVAAYSGSLIVVVIAMSFAMAGISAMVGPFWAIPATLLGPAEAAVGIALINSLGNFGGFLGPNVIGFFRHATGGFKGGFLTVGSVVCLTALLALLLPVRSPGLRDSQKLKKS